MKQYALVEAFLSPQGEGARVGTINVFVRFAGCNLQCVDGKALGRPLQGREVDAKFFCDTDFAQAKGRMTAEEIVELVKRLDVGSCGWVILTGGEPSLQVDGELVRWLRSAGYKLAIETNGTGASWSLFHSMYDWISCSPKPGTRVGLEEADEVRCVVKAGQAPDARGVRAKHYFVSPAFKAPTADKLAGWSASPADLDPEACAWAVEWCRHNPMWRVSMQVHKLLGVR